MWLFKMVASMRDSLRSVLMRFSLAWMPTTQFLVNEREPVANQTLLQRSTKQLTISQQTNTLQHILDDDGFKDIQLR